MEKNSDSDPQSKDESITSPIEQSQSVKGSQNVLFIKMPKSRAEINRDYRNKQKAKLEEAKSTIPKRKKTKAEINRDYRNRQKAKNLAKRADVSPAIPKHKKTKAEINRDYRNKQKAICQQLLEDPDYGELHEILKNPSYCKPYQKTFNLNEQLQLDPLALKEVNSQTKKNKNVATKKLTDTDAEMLSHQFEPTIQFREMQKKMINANKCKRYRERLKLEKRLELDALLSQEDGSQTIRAVYNDVEEGTDEKLNDTCVDTLNQKGLEPDPLSLEEGDHTPTIKIEYNDREDKTAEKLINTHIDMLTYQTQPSMQLIKVEYNDIEDDTIRKLTNSHVDILNNQLLEHDPLALEQDGTQRINIEYNHMENEAAEKLTDIHVVTLNNQYADEPDPLALEEADHSQKTKIDDQTEPPEQKEITRKKRNADKCKRYRDRLKLNKQRLELDALISQKEESETVNIEHNAVVNGTAEKSTDTHVVMSNEQCLEHDPLALEENDYLQAIKNEYMDIEGGTTEKLIDTHLHLLTQHTQPSISCKRKVPEEFRESLKKKQTESEAQNDNMQRIKIEDLSSEVSSDIEIHESTYDNDVKSNVTALYTNYYKHTSGHLEFYNEFKNNQFGHSCAVCDRLWCEKDLKMTSRVHENVLQKILPNYVCGTTVRVCSTCKVALDKQKIPLMSTCNGFSYPTIPSHLPTLNLIEQRLISPRIAFMQIRRLRHVNGQRGIYSQVVNVPVEVNTMINQLPRNIKDDHCFYVHVENKLIHRTSDFEGLINKRNIKEWLTYLVQTPLYIDNNIKIDDAFVDSNQIASKTAMDGISEHVPFEDDLTAQQQTLLWNEDRFLNMSSSEKKIPFSILFNKNAEELSFPTIYGGQVRTYTKGLNATSFMQASSELRRTDRRGVDPQHLLYMAAKIMRQKISQSVSIASKHNVGYETKITKENVQSENYINTCIETNLAFLRCVPNSAWYWSDRKKDVFAMIRQLGAPTAFMSLSANETGWTDLLKLLYKLKNNGADVSDEFLAEISYMHKAKLVNDDAVTCAIYFNKVVNCLLRILQYKKKSPFGKYRVNHYFKRMEFYRGSPRAYFLLWLDNAPKNMLNNSNDVIQMIDELVSVSILEASGNIKHQTHQHTSMCYKKIDNVTTENCTFGAPFMPSRKTIILLPTKESDCIKKHYKLIKSNLEKFNYTDFDDFYTHNSIVSDEHYYRIICAGINRPTLFYRRTPSEKWQNPFNPFVLHHLKSSMDFQIILDEYACATYVAEYINKHKNGISDLQRQIIEIMDEHPEFDIADISKKMSIDVLRHVEMSAQEAAWYLLRESISKSSVTTAYIPTVHITERERIRKILKELSALDDDCADTWKVDWFLVYETRPIELNDVTLAQFVAKYFTNKKGIYVQRETPKVISYRNYDMVDNFDDYRREMVLLHIPFRCEEYEIIKGNKFIKIYEVNKDLILDRRKEFESNFGTEKLLQICSQLCK